MEIGDRSFRPFRFSDPRQERIYHRLLLVGPGPASFYRDACQLMATEPALDTTTHIVAHLLREIESALRDVLESVVNRSKPPAKKKMSDEQTHKDEIRAILKALEISESAAVARAWLALARKLMVFAHRDALSRPRPLDLEFRKFWDEMEDILHAVLDRFESRYLETHHLLDDLLAKPSPSRADARILRSRIPNNLFAFSYFFDNLTNPAWLDPLRKEGFFRHPPEPDIDYEKRTVRFPPLAESRHLARMAALKPTLVRDIALKTPDTENVRVYEDLADAALAMPAELAAKVVPKAKRWTESPYQLLLPEKLGKFIAHLARGGQVEAALDLAHTLLTVLPDPRMTEPSGDEKGLPVLPEPRARFDLWSYEQILRDHIPELLEAAGERALSMLCDLLADAVRLSRRNGEGSGPEDASFIWRPAIEAHSQNLPNGLRNILISAVRDAAIHLAKKDPSGVPCLVRIFESLSW